MGSLSYLRPRRGRREKPARNRLYTKSATNSTKLTLPQTGSRLMLIKPPGGRRRHFIAHLSDMSTPSALKVSRPAPFATRLHSALKGCGCHPWRPLRLPGSPRVGRVLASLFSCREEEGDTGVRELPAAGGRGRLSLAAHISKKDALCSLIGYSALLPFAYSACA